MFEGLALGVFEGLEKTLDRAWGTSVGEFQTDLLYGTGRRSLKVPRCNAVSSTWLVTTELLALTHKIAKAVCAMFCGQKRSNAKVVATVKG